VTLSVDALATGTISNTACYNPGGLPIGQLCDTTTTTVNPVVARMRSVSATRARNGVLVRWRTASEIDMLGYKVYREVRGHRVRLNRLVITAKNHAATYSYLDRTASKRPGRYYIQAISLDGTRSWFGPARVRG
jgi:hypothetical protein